MLCTAALIASVIEIRPWIGDMLSTRARLQNQQACLNHVWPKDAVVYDWKPTHISNSAATGAAYTNLPEWFLFRQLNPEVPDFRNFPDEPQRFEISEKEMLPLGTVFLHELTDARGIARLVVIQLYSYQGSLDFFSYVVEIGSAKKAARTVSIGPGFDVDLDATSEPFVIYGGQVDPTDDRHLTIAYAASGSRSFIDGAIDESGRLSLVPREGSIAAGRWRLPDAPSPDFGLGSRRFNDIFLDSPRRIKKQEISPDGKRPY